MATLEEGTCCRSCGREIKWRDQYYRTGGDLIFCLECYETAREIHSDLVTGVWDINNGKGTKNMEQAITRLKRYPELVAIWEDFYDWADCNISLSTNDC